MPEPSAPSPTTADLVEEAVARGEIDENTALLYRVYGVFGDPHLPAEYRADEASEDLGGIYAAQQALGSMPAEIADQLRPFLVRPTDPASVFYDVGGATAGAGQVSLAAWRPAGAAPPPQAALGTVVCNPDPLSDWGYVEGVAPFKVWGSCETAVSQAEIQLAAAMVEELWDDESEFLQRTPIIDDGLAIPDEWVDDQGGDSRIDIYLANTCVYRGGMCLSIPGLDGLTTPSPQELSIKGVKASSSYVVIPPFGRTDPMKMRAVLAHELFHVFQLSMNVGGLLFFGRAHWFAEASATWAEWHFVPPAGPGVASWFQAFQISPLPLSSTLNNNDYKSFAWPLFMDEEYGDQTVAAAWQAIEGQPDWPGITNAIDAQVPFKTEFRNFAVRNWNEDLEAGSPLDPLYPDQPTGPRSQPGGFRRDKDQKLLPAPPGPMITEINVQITALYDFYKEFSVDQDVGQIILDFSGVGPPGSFDADALVEVKDKGWEYRKLKKGTTTWCMDNPDDDITTFIVILSNHEKTVGAQVAGKWTVQSPLEPCISYQVHIDWTDTYNGIDDNFTFDGWADTVDPDLSGEGVVTLTGTGTITGERPGWRSCNPGFPGVPSGSGAAEFVASVSGDIVSISAFPALSSTDFGVSTQPFTMDRKGGELTLSSPGNVGGSLCPHSWTGTIFASLELKEPLGNDEGD